MVLLIHAIISLLEKRGRRDECLISLFRTVIHWSSMDSWHRSSRKKRTYLSHSQYNICWCFGSVDYIYAYIFRICLLFCVATNRVVLCITCKFCMFHRIDTNYTNLQLISLMADSIMQAHPQLGLQFRLLMQVCFSVLDMMGLGTEWCLVW